MAAATPEIKVSELICFLFNNISKSTPSLLKSVITNFYTDVELNSAKELLHTDVSSALTSITLPRLVKRKGDIAVQKTYDDLVEILNLVDENLLWPKLPRYVAADLSRIPVLSMDNVDPVAINRRFDAIEARLAMMEMRDLTLPTVDSQPTSVSEENTDALPADANVNLWSNIAKNARKAGFMISNVKHKSPNTSNTISKNSTVGAKSRRKVGSGVPLGGGIKAGVNIIPKSVFHLDNFEPNCSETDITNHLKSNNISVLTLFKAKSWMREEERDNVSAFRVCVKTTDSETIANCSFWPEGVIIRPWKFKGKQTAQDV